MTWIPVGERRPEAPKAPCYLSDLPEVAVVFVGRTGHRGWARAVWCPAKTVDASDWNDGSYVWDENDSDSWGEEGWYECREEPDDDTWWRLDSGEVRVTHWAEIVLPKE